VPPPPTLAALVAAVRAAPPRLGGVRLVCLDGPAGSGKTTLADRLAAALGDVPVVHLDDVYEGWDGLAEPLWARLLSEVLEPLAAGRPGSYRRYDWYAGELTERVPVPVAAVLVVEGVGAAARPVDPLASLRVWVEAPRELRWQRLVDRDGERVREQLRRWVERESAHFAADGTRRRADVRLDGSDPLPD
jgi:uridine kinase